MKKVHRILSVFLVFIFVFCGCGKKNQNDVEKIFVPYQCNFLFDDINTFVCVTKNGESVNASNRFDNTALSLYETLKTDRLKPAEKPGSLNDKDFISLNFGSLSSGNELSETPDFKITTDDILIFGNQYFKVISGVYEDISSKVDSLFAEKNTYYKENGNSQKNTISLLKTDGSVLKDLEFSGKEILYKNNILLLQDSQSGLRYFYDRQNAVLSDAVSNISDYFEGYICSVEERQLKLINILDKDFSYYGKNFDRPVLETDNPFVSLSLNDKNTAEISYLTDTNELYLQKYDLSPFYKDYEDKKAKAPAKAVVATPKPQAPASTKNYETVTPSYSTASGIIPFTAELESKLMSFDNTRKGYGWKGSEDRQDYYSKFNAYATGDRNKSTVYLTFDEGYEYNENTNKILDILASKNVKAVFFVTMDFAKKRPDLVRRMIDEGHTVGNHSTTHPSFPNISLQSGYNEIINLHNYILTNFGYTMNLFRFPEGASSERTLQLVNEMGYASVFWNCAYKDWDTANQPSPDTTRALIANNTQNGTIYLLHAVSNTNVSMLGEIIDTLRSSGYELGLFGKP